MCGKQETRHLLWGHPEETESRREEELERGPYRETGAQAWARRGSKRSENGADG